MQWRQKLGAEERAEINRKNAQRSTGPKTPEGKAKSSRNSFKHGAYSEQLVLSSEDAAALNERRADLRAQHQPANETERILVNELAEKFWRIRRARLFEVNAPEDRAKLKALAAVQRMMSSAERGFHRSLATLRQLRKERQKDGFVSQDSPALSATPARSAERSERVRNLDGSVPQNTDHDQRKPTSPFERARCQLTIATCQT